MLDRESSLDIRGIGKKIAEVLSLMIKDDQHQEMEFRFEVLQSFQDFFRPRRMEESTSSRDLSNTPRNRDGYDKPTNRSGH